jgi:hypothetical protein
MKNILIRYGLIGGLIVSVLMTASMPLWHFPEDYSLALISGYVSILLSLSAVFMAVKNYRDRYNNGKISFGKAFLIGIYITLIAGSIYSLSFIVYNEMTDGAFYDMFRDMQVEEVNKMNISEADKATKISEVDKEVKMMSNPVVIFLFSTIVEYGFPGLIVSLLAAAILRRKEKEGRIITQPQV